ncbi:MAG TPA: hypothetical protein VL154_07250 [Acetobacteraceae bacterium]|nr:hypothetical protein [Acetobacteraceae bacterium]
MRRATSSTSARVVRKPQEMPGLAAGMPNWLASEAMPGPPALAGRAAAA